jgi:phenylalanyl-tRNA synthetase beta chain
LVSRATWRLSQGSPLTAPAVAATELASGAKRAVRVDDAVACPRFVSRVVEGIDPRAPTPDG